MKEGLVEFDVAKAAATNPADFDLKMNFLGGGDEAEEGTGGDMSRLFG